MTTQDKKEMYRHNVAVGAINAHRHGLSWKHIHEILSAQTSDVWQKHRAMLEQFPENAKHSSKEK